ncbi:16S rRNA (guanine(966)-N(2))-methyltransferase RsmD [Thiohalocapsa marina]|uniref:Ribosomal RNA small subunit methyltransferase D n=1 Tax=Thiohalocapsa marina TaxID=424902 RepID=A0A5M8FSR3_9GAMM|nr:16S rRNA (guanine(966)-N(2))-methyltransferase RsmD [Thiohalocapsa marina]
MRLIGGRWRGRRLAFVEQPGLRPTSDRVRETLFNWLAPVIEGSECLDCFAGSGALGLEAASRGAASVVLLEQAAAAARQLRGHLAALAADSADVQIEVAQADALDWLRRQTSRRFDLVFLDPPFDGDLLGPACELLARRGWVGPGSLIYLETDGARALPDLPAGWQLIRDKRAGQVRYALAEVVP